MSWSAKAVRRHAVSSWPASLIDGGVIPSRLRSHSRRMISEYYIISSTLAVLVLSTIPRTERFERIRVLLARPRSWQITILADCAQHLTTVLRCRPPLTLQRSYQMEVNGFPLCFDIFEHLHDGLHSLEQQRGSFPTNTAAYSSQRIRHQHSLIYRILQQSIHLFKHYCLNSVQ